MVSAGVWAVSHFLRVCWNLSLDFGAGGGVVGRGVLLGDAQVAQEGFEGVAAAGEAGGADHGVIGEHRRPIPVVVCGFVEGVDHDGPGGAAVGGDGERVARMVV